MKKLKNISNLLLAITFVMGLSYFGYYHFTHLIAKDPHVLTTLTLPEFKKTAQIVAAKYSTQATKTKALIRPFAQMKKYLFDKSISSKVLVGREGWLYLWEETPQINLLKQSLGITQLTPLQIKEKRLLIEQKSHWFAQQGIAYYRIIAPNKASIYPEFISTELKPHAPHFVDAIVEDLQNNTTVNVIDVRPILREAKKDFPVFQKTDTHWTHYGAYFAYRTVMEKLVTDSLSLAAKPLDFFEIEKKDYKGDLARIAMLQNELKDIEHYFKIKTGKKWQRQDSLILALKKLRAYLITSYPEALNKKVVFMHDSYGERIVPFFANHFSQLISFWNWGYLDPHFMLKEKPDFVLDEEVERTHVKTHFLNPPMLVNAYWKQHFEQNKIIQNSKNTSLEKVATAIKKTIKNNKDLVLVELVFESKKEGKLAVENDYIRGVYYYPVSVGENRIYLQLDNNFPINLTWKELDDLKIQSATIAIY